MANKMLIDATHAEETRVVVVDGNKVEEFDFESENKRQLAGNIYLAKITRVEPSLQAAFVDYGGNRHGFLAFSEIHPDYYQIPVADREALLEEERAYAEAQDAEGCDEDQQKPRRRSRGSRSRSRSKAEKTASTDAVAASDTIAGMETIDTDEAVAEPATDAAVSPMERVAETPVEEPAGTTAAGDGNGDSAGPAEGPDAAPDVEESDAPQALADAAERDDDIESVAEEDDSEDIRPVRKPRPRKYKIQEVVKVRQIMLVQVVKEERGNKGAALTTYLSLAGRYCVLMPNTARGGGISRKITNAADRKKLKEIAAEMEVPRGAGLIIRTAGANRTKAEIKRDYEYLQRLWEQIRDLTLKSIAPAQIYEEGNLIKRSIRDLYSRDIDEVLVEGEAGYRAAKDFMKMIMPSHAKNVKHYQDTMPLFARYQVESYLSSMFNPTVQLRSGGYIVIGVTEALVAIDVNSGRATREGSIEETALKTNLEAAEEVARQLRLRDLAGLIVIDFIDMDERKNNAAVEKRLKDKLKSDRARIQVSRISGFGLLEMSRQRLRPGMIEATTQPCPACHGTGLIRSDDNLALSILRQIEEEGVRRRSREVLVRCPVSVANYLMNAKREHVARIEARYGLSVRIEGDPLLVSPDFGIEKFKTAIRAVPEAAPVVSVDSSLMDAEETDEADEVTDEAEIDEVAAPEGDEDRPKKKRRRRRRKPRSRGRDDEETTQADGAGDDDQPQAEGEPAREDAEVAESPVAGEPQQGAEAPVKKPRRGRKPRATAKTAAEEPVEASATEETPAPEPAAEAGTGAGEEEVAKPPRKRPSRSRAKKAPEPGADAEPQATPEPAEAAPAATAPEREPAAAVAASVPPESAAEDDAPPQSKRRGWWSLGR